MEMMGTIIERYCEQLAEYVAEEQKLLPWESFAGCEWWVQDVAHDEPPKAYHTDCVLEEDKDKRKKKYYPLLSTVYYGKTERGGATVAFDEEEYDAMRKCVVVRSAWPKSQTGKIPNMTNSISAARPSAWPAKPFGHTRAVGARPEYPQLSGTTYSAQKISLS